VGGGDPSSLRKSLGARALPGPKQTLVADATAWSPLRGGRRRTRAPARCTPAGAGPCGERRAQSLRPRARPHVAGPRGGGRGGPRGRVYIPAKFPDGRSLPAPSAFPARAAQPFGPCEKFPRKNARRAAGPWSRLEPLRGKGRAARGAIGAGARDVCGGRGARRPGWKARSALLRSARMTRAGSLGCRGLGREGRDPGP
jgi:hypothetical protein